MYVPISSTGGSRVPATAPSLRLLKKKEAPDARPDVLIELRRMEQGLELEAIEQGLGLGCDP